MNPRLVVFCVATVGILISGCFGASNDPTPIESLPLKVSPTLSDGHPAWLVQPEEGASWALRVAAWSPRSVRIEFRAEDAEFRPSGLTQYGFIEPPQGAPLLAAAGSGKNLVLAAPGLRVEIANDPAGPLVTLNGKGPFQPRQGATGTEFVDPATQTERFYGMGQVFSGIEHRGKVLTAHLRYGTWDEARLSATPFYLSSDGYGVLVDTTYSTSTDFASENSPNVVLTSVPEGDLRVFLFDGPRFTTILQDYANATGKAVLPPLWMFGYIQSKFGYFDRTQLEEVARRLRAEDYPTDVLVLDYYWRQNTRMEWVEAGWPLHRQMLDALHAQGFKIILHEDTEQMRFYPDAPAGYRYATERGESPGLQILDVSNPAATRWYWTDLHEPLINEALPGGLIQGGVDGFWIDEIDWAPESGSQPYHNGMLPAEMHNLYANLFTRAVAQPFIDDLDTRPVVITRSYWTGGQRYPHVWSGDTGTTFEVFENDIHAGLSMGLSGFAFWGDDLGGFWGKPSDELHVRWAAQFGAFSPFMRVHGTGVFPVNMQTAYQTREPWDYGAEAQSIFRTYDKLRYRMLPYIYSLAHDAAETGLPILRALILEYQDDAEVARLDSEYLFGPAFLVAPVYESGSSRPVYLPAGTWYDFWTDERRDCVCNFTWTGDLATFPVYVRAGGIVPMGPDVSFVGEKKLDPLTIHVWPQAHGTFRLVEDDGESLDYRTGGVAARILRTGPQGEGFLFDYPSPTGSFKTSPRSVHVVFHDVDPTLEAFVDGKAATKTVQDRTLTVKMPAGDEAFRIELR